MNIINTAKSFGCHDVVTLGGKPEPRHLDYLDLLNTSKNECLKIDAVAEFQSRPLLYIKSGDRIRNFDKKERLDLQCLLANRGERAFLGILTPGELNVYPINLNRSILTRISGMKIKQESPDAPLFFQSVVDGVFDMEGQPKVSDFVFRTIINLMTKSSETLIGKGLVPRYIVWVNTGSTLPLIRKTIAVRFLIVRNPLARILATLIKLLSPSSMPLLI